MATQHAWVFMGSGGSLGGRGFLIGRWGVGGMLLLLGLLGAVTAACSTTSPAASQPPVTILYSSGQPHSNLPFAAERGFFKNEGVNVDMRMFTSGAEASEAYKTGVGDIVAAGEIPSSKLWTAFEDTVAIAQVSKDTELTMIEAGPGVNGAADLKGKKVATVVGSTMEYMVLLYLKANNIKPEEVTILNMPGAGDMMAALEKGDIVAFSHVQPSGWQAEATTKGAHVLSTAKGLAWNASVLNVRRSWLDKNRDTAKKLLTGYNKASKFMKAPENANDVVDWLAKQQRSTPDLMRRILAGQNYDVMLDQELKNHLNGVSGFLMERKIITRPIDVSKDFDTSVLKSVDPALVTWQ